MKSKVNSISKKSLARYIDQIRQMIQTIVVAAIRDPSLCRALFSFQISVGASRYDEYLNLQIVSLQEAASMPNRANPITS